MSGNSPTGVALSVVVAALCVAEGIVACASETSPASDAPDGAPSIDEAGTFADARSGSEAGAAMDAAAGNADGSVPSGPPSITSPPPVTIDEEETAVVALTSSGIRRFDVEGLPPGATFDGTNGTITFRPDFTQSGTYSITVHGRGAGPTVTASVVIEVRDSIAPPAPFVVNQTPGPGFTRLVVRQTTDTFLDSPANAGRWFDAVVVVPDIATAASPAPVEVFLHGFAAGPNFNAGSTLTFRIEPSDPENTYWWGYGDSLPGPTPTSGHVNDYTVRRVLHLLDWLVRTYPSADPERVFSTGISMGGAGAIALGLRHARHFAGIEAFIGQAIARNHRPSRVSQLTTLWGSPEANLDGTWDALDGTRVLEDSPEAAEQFAFTKHGKDDPTIHFGAVVFKSPLTGKTWYEALEQRHVGHLSIWDEGAHGPADPVLGDGWWDAGWSRITDAEAFLSRGKAFPAFSRSAANGNPGDGSGNGIRPFDAESGYSGNVAIAGDTGWSGDIAGALNRFLRWDTPGIVDTADKLVLPLHIVTTPGGGAPIAGYPTTGDFYDGTEPLVADVTPRRAKAFRPNPGETVHYRFGTRTGDVVTASDGTVTVPALPIAATLTSLELDRDAP